MSSRRHSRKFLNYAGFKNPVYITTETFLCTSFLLPKCKIHELNCNVASTERQRYKNVYNPAKRECSLSILVWYRFFFSLWSPCLCYHEKVLKWKYTSVTYLTASENANSISRYSVSVRPVHYFPVILILFLGDKTGWIYWPWYEFMRFSRDKTPQRAMKNCQ